MKSKWSLPPKFADKLLSWFCKDEVLENIQGDLYEVYNKRVDVLGKRRADLLYYLDVLSILRPRLIRRPEGSRQLNQYGIFRNYLRTFTRSIKHNALFSGINAAGLAISMSAGILMIVLLSELNSFDDFHEKKDRIYRVTTSRKALFQGELEFFASAPHYIADVVKDQIPGVEQVLILDRDMTADLKTVDRGTNINGYYASPSFFDVFSFKLKKGNPRTALENPGSIVLTESVAKKLFGDSDPVDKTVNVENNADFRIGIITGIIEDVPSNSHINFDALVSMKTVDNSLVEAHRNRNPGRYAQSYVYLVLEEGTKVADVEAVMSSAMADYNSHSAPNILSLQPMEEFLSRNAGFPPGPIFSKEKVDMMIALALIILLSACFNYTNLSLVRGLRRSKEICVRKITGAKTLQIFSQFMTESVLLSLLSLIAGIGLFFIIKPEFLALPSLNGGDRAMFLLNILPIQLLYFVLFAIVVGCVAGFVPALILSKLKANALFNDASKIKVYSGFSARQILTTCQVALSIGLIMFTVIALKQYKYALNYDLGYDTENIINVTVKKDYIDVLENEYARIAGVVETSKSSVILGTRNLMPADAMSEDQSDTIMFSSNYIDGKYLSMHGFKLLAGSGFTSDPYQDSIQNSDIIVNEQFLKALDLGSPNDAIGKYIWYFGEEKLKIRGVVRDFISMSLDAEAPKAFGFLNRPADEEAVLGVNVAGTNLIAVMQGLETTYKKVDNVHPFKATFYDDQIARTYEESKSIYTIVSFLAFLAISISTLGLLGMAIFTIETRMKEICIRKVLGAGILNLILMLSRNILIIIVIGAAIAIPFTRYIVDDVILNNFLYKTEIGFIELFSGLAIVLFISVLTVGWQLLKAATQNPTDLLRDG